jgi:hypothetical protein
MAPKEAGCWAAMAVARSRPSKGDCFADDKAIEDFASDEKLAGSGIKGVKVRKKC